MGRGIVQLGLLWARTAYNKGIDRPNRCSWFRFETKGKVSLKTGVWKGRGPQMLIGRAVLRGEREVGLEGDKPGTGQDVPGTN